MKRLLLATAALSVLAASHAGPSRAQSIDLRQLCNPALGRECPAVTVPRVRVQTPEATVVKPQVQIVVPRQVTPERTVTPPVVKPDLRVVTPSKTVKPDVRVVTPSKTVKPDVRVATPSKTVTPRVTAPDTRIAVPPKVVLPVPRGPEGPRVVIKPGDVSVEDLRKRLAADLLGGGAARVAPPPDQTVKAAPRPGATVRVPDAGLDVTRSQLQADLVTLRSAAALAAAAAGADTGAVKLTDRTLTRSDVRLSSEDFAKAPEGPAATDYSRIDLGKILQRGDRVVTNTGDRVVVENAGVMRVLRNDDVLLAQPGTQVQSFQYKDGSTRSLMAYENGSRVETIRAPDGRVMRRTSIEPDGTEIVLFDDTQASEQVVVNQLPEVQGPTVVAYRSDSNMTEALTTQSSVEAGRRFSLAQVRDIDAVRHLAPGINIDSIHFASGSAAIRPEEAEDLAALGYAMLEAISRDPTEVFLIEGHTDARGGPAFNLALSDRRAESVALALIEYFGVPPQNMVLQGYGEGDLLVKTEAAEQANRRAAVRRITELLTET